MVQHGVVAVVAPFTDEGPTEVPTIVAAGIPYIVVTGASSAELSTSGAYALESGFPSYIGAMALSAEQHGYKNVAFLVDSTPATLQTRADARRDRLQGGGCHPADRAGEPGDGGRLRRSSRRQCRAGPTPSASSAT